MAEPLRIGVAGLGAVAELHIAACQNVSGASVVAGADRDEQRGSRMAERYGFRAYAEVDSMLREVDLDAVCALVPAAAHRDIVVACAEAGLHVLCEKPLASSTEDAIDMLTACRRAGVKLFYGASYRFLPAVIAARRAIHAGAIGDVTLLVESCLGGGGIDAYRSLPFSHYPEGQPGGPGLGLVDHGIHMIDLFPWLLDSRIDRVSGRGIISGGPPTTEYMLMQLDNGAIGYLLYNNFTFSTDLPQHGAFSQGLSWSSDGSLKPEGSWVEHPGVIHVYGTRGALRVGHYLNSLHLTDSAGVRELPVVGDAAPAHFASQLESFVDCIRGDRPPEVAGEDGFRALVALLAAYESERVGAAITIPEHSARQATQNRP